VGLSGSNGYIPATVDLGFRVTPKPWVKALASLQYARWSGAPSPVADVSLDIGLGLSPGELQGRFVSPRFRDTISPRLGLEFLPQGPDGLLRVRAGYLYSPSPVPRQTGFSSLADAPFHALSAGLGFDFGSVWGVHMQSNFAAHLALLSKRTFDKSNDVLPFASYDVGGQILHLSAAVEGAWE
jgi:long-subunit fatty acid transport protein